MHSLLHKRRELLVTGREFLTSYAHLSHHRSLYSRYFFGITWSFGQSTMYTGRYDPSNSFESVSPLGEVIFTIHSFTISCTSFEVTPVLLILNCS